MIMMVSVLLLGCTSTPISDDVLELNSQLDSYSFSTDVLVNMSSEYRDKIEQYVYGITSDVSVDKANAKLAYIGYIHLPTEEDMGEEMKMETQLLETQLYYVDGYAYSKAGLGWSQGSIPFADVMKKTDTFQQIFDFMRTGLCAHVSDENVDGVQYQVMECTDLDKFKFSYQDISSGYGGSFDQIKENDSFEYSLHAWVNEETSFVEKIVMELLVVKKTQFTKDTLKTDTIASTIEINIYDHNKPLSIAIPEEAREKEKLFAFELTEPVGGYDILDNNWGHDKCAELGDDWIWAHWHVAGNAGVPNALRGKYDGDLSATAAWTWITNQPWECYESGRISVMGYVNYVDEYGKGMSASLEKQEGDFLSVDWLNGETKTLCEEELPLICIKALNENSMFIYDDLEEYKSSQADYEALIEKAVQEKDISLCADQTNKADCASQVITQIDDVDAAFCDTIRKNEVFEYVKNSPAQRLSDDCFMQLHETYEDISLCDGLVQENQCLQLYVRVTGDTSICETHEWNSQYAWRDCYINLAVYRGDPDMCDDIVANDLNNMQNALNICKKSVEENS